jgi:hypothetical protein
MQWQRSMTMLSRPGCTLPTACSLMAGTIAVQANCTSHALRTCHSDELGKSIAPRAVCCAQRLMQPANSMIEP